MKILITAFGSFLKNNINSSLECMNELPSSIDDAEIFKYELPVSYIGAQMKLLALIEEKDPDLVISLGLAGSRDYISLENRAYNLMDSKSPDNDGNIFINKKIDENEKNYIISQLDLAKIQSNLNTKYSFIKISNDPGRYVCNTVYFTSLSIQNKNNLKSIFIHLPNFNVIEKEAMVNCLIDIIGELTSNY